MPHPRVIFQINKNRQNLEDPLSSGEFWDMEVQKHLNKSISNSNIDYNSHERYLFEFFSNNMSYMKFRKEYLHSLQLNHEIPWRQLELESSNKNKIILLEIDKTLILITHDPQHDLHLVSLVN